MSSGAGLREAAKDVARHASAVARLQAELTRSEIRNSGLVGVGAAVFGGIGFLLLTTLFVIALAIPLPAWLATLIVALVYLLVAGLLGMRFRQERTQGVAKEQARITSAALRGTRGDVTAPSVPAVPRGPAATPRGLSEAVLDPSAPGSHGDPG